MSQSSAENTRSNSPDKDEPKDRHRGSSAQNRSERAEHARGADYEICFEEGTAQANRDGEPIEKDLTRKG